MSGGTWWGEGELPVTISWALGAERSQNAAGGVTSEEFSPLGVPLPQGRTGLWILLRGLL